MNDPSEIAQLRQAMETFIVEAKKSELDKIKLESERLQCIEKELREFLNKTANLVREGKIQAATHVVKFTHPDARGTNLYTPGNSHIGDRGVSSHVVNVGNLSDGICNTAEYMPYLKFLNIRVNRKRLWQRAVENDPILFAALPGDETAKRAWIAAFATLPQPKGGPASHTLAKQLYWPLGDGEYLLLQPLFPSSLVHAVWERLRGDRFSEAAQSARQARREGRPHPHGYRAWPRLVIQRFGGEQKQNISLLNTNAYRRGEAWLLPSVPPTWHSREIALPLKVESLFEHFGRLRRVREQIDELGRYLVGVRDWNNLRIRRGRAHRVEAIIDELIQYTAAIRQHTPDWSTDPACRLPAAQKLWLDPDRDDPDFQRERAAADWRRQVAESFAAWLNAQLRRYRLPVGDAEYRAWRREFEAQLHEALEEMEA